MLLEFVQRRAEGGQTVVFVSHRLQEVLSVASRFTVLRDGRVAGSLQGAPGEDELVELIAGTGVERSRSTGVAAAGEAIFKMEGVTAAHVSDLNLVVNRGEIVGLAGLQGSGRSTVLELAFGVVPVEAGSMELEGMPYAPRDVRTAMARGVALVPEQRLADAAFVDMSLCDNLTAAVIPRYWRGWMRRDVQRRDSHDLIGKFGVKAPGPLAPFVTLSGGNQQKAIVARWLRREPTLILLDEPTQGVDIIARHDIYNTIREAAGRGAGVIVASSDLEELETLCDRVIVLRGGAVAGELGSWEATPDRVTALAQTDVVSGGAR
jgi:ribose transport system ATP-binding protein